MSANQTSTNIELTNQQVNFKEIKRQLKKATTINFSGSHITGITTMLFWDFKDLEEVDLSNCIIDLEGHGNNSRGMFQECHNLKRVNLTNCKIQHTGKISLEMFFDTCENLEEIIGLESFMQLNSNISRINGMFNRCKLLKVIDFGDNFQFPSVHCELIFSDCSSLEYLNIGNINATLESSYRLAMFNRVNPNCKVKYTGKFKIKPIEKEKNPEFIYRPVGNEQINTQNRWSELFIKQGNTEMILKTVLNGLNISREEVKDVEVITYKTPEELETYKLKQKLLETNYMDLVEGLAYFIDDFSKFIIMQQA